jgi:hypothetical protein
MECDFGVALLKGTATRKQNTNDRQQAEVDKQQTTNNTKQAINGRQQMANDKEQTADDGRQAANDGQQAAISKVARLNDQNRVDDMHTLSGQLSIPQKHLLQLRPRDMC